jgi:hypothetical protein
MRYVLMLIGISHSLSRPRPAWDFFVIFLPGSRFASPSAPVSSIGIPPGWDSGIRAGATTHFGTVTARHCGLSARSRMTRLIACGYTASGLTRHIWPPALLPDRNISRSTAAAFEGIAATVGVGFEGSFDFVAYIAKHFQNFVVGAFCVSGINERPVMTV